MADIKIVEVKDGVETVKTEAPVKKVKAEETMSPADIQALIKSRQVK